MDLKKMMSSWQGASQVAAAMVVANVALVGVVLLMTVKMVQMHERIVLLPPHLDKRATVGWNSADAEYLKGYGMYFANLTGNLTPKSAPVVADILSSQVDASIYPDVRKQILAVAKNPVFVNSGGAITFDTTSVEYEAQTNRVFVVGETTTKNAAGVTDKSNNVVELDVRLVDGRPHVMGTWTYAGNEPHDQAWRDTKGAAASAAAAQASQAEAKE